VLVLALVALPVRGVIAATAADSWGLLPVQILDGVGAGLLGVATPGLVARILAGTGHVNAGLGAVMTLQGVGAASSPALAGLVAQQAGYSAAFLALGGIAAIGLAFGWSRPRSSGRPAATISRPALPRQRKLRHDEPWFRTRARRNSRRTHPKPREHGGIEQRRTTMRSLVLSTGAVLLATTAFAQTATVYLL
jgi:MFS transporter